MAIEALLSLRYQGPATVADHRASWPGTAKKDSHVPQMIQMWFLKPRLNAV